MSSKLPAKNDDVHRPLMRPERFRAWIESLPKMRLYVILTVFTWLTLTLLIGIESNPLASLGYGDKKSKYEVGAVSEEDIFAPRSVTYEDPIATKQAQLEAADTVDEIYFEDGEIPKKVQSDLEAFSNKIDQIRNSDAPAEKKVDREIDATPFYVPQNAARNLVFLDDDEVAQVEKYARENLKDLYEATPVSDDNVDAPSSVMRITAARERLVEAAGQDASGEVGDLVAIISEGFLAPNYVVDRAATEDARKDAVSSVEPVQSTVQQQERIVGRGEVFDRQDIAQLEALNVIRDANPWTVFLGVGLVVATEMGVAWYFMERFGRRVLKANAAIRILLSALLTVLFTLLARAFISLGYDPYLTPLAGLSILGTILLGPRLMFLMVVISSINIGIIGGGDFLLTAALLLSSGFAIYTAVRVSSRQELLRAGIFIALVTAVVTFAVSLVGGSGLPVAVWQGVKGMGNGLLSLMLAMVLLPLFESAFNLLTPMKLLELSNPTNELIHKLLQKTPGTFAHSMQVGTLAENAAERIGADALLARVGSYYHDIGKMEHPGYFVENQIGQVNPHNALSPALSARVIKRHVKDGLEIGRAWNLPREILEIIAQHHGSTRIEYFYRKAVEEAGEGEKVRESEFRYSSGRPRSKEAGIVMLADSVEATVKALPKPTPKRIEDVVADTIKHKLEDGQFDQCALTMHEIQEAGDAIRESMVGFLGPRIEYPDGPPSAEKKTQTPKPPSKTDSLPNQTERVP
jgi:putative nucleotidyltransferase with HDIG domain